MLHELFQEKPGVTKYDGFTIDGNTVWISQGDTKKEITLHVFIPGNETFEEYANRNKPIIFQIGSKKQGVLGT